MGYMRVVHYADSDVDRLTVITKTCIIYIALSAVSTTHPYPANSLAGLGGGGWVAGAGLVGGAEEQGGAEGRSRASAKGPQKKPLRRLTIFPYFSLVWTATHPPSIEVWA
jgi:hypothetical protein